MPVSSQPARNAGQVGHVLVGDGHEQAVVLLEGAGRDVAKERVLLDALHGRLLVVHGVARAAVQQAVVATRWCPDVNSPRSTSVTCDAAQREVVRERAAGTAAADDQDMWARTRH